MQNSKQNNSINSVIKDGSIIVCGSGGCAEEVIAEFKSKVYCIYDPLAKKRQLLGKEIYNDLDAIPPSLDKDLSAIIAIANPAIIKKVISELNLKKIKLANPLVSSRALITGANTTIDIGSIVMPGTIITENVKIGKACFIHSNCTVGHGTILEDFVSIMPITAIAGNVLLREGTFIGSLSFVKERTILAKGSIVGAKAGVFNSITEANKTWIGSPIVKLEK